MRVPVDVLRACTTGNMHPAEFITLDADGVLMGLVGETAVKTCHTVIEIRAQELYVCVKLFPHVGNMVFTELQRPSQLENHTVKRPSSTFLSINETRETVCRSLTLHTEPDNKLARYTTTHLYI